MIPPPPISTRTDTLFPYPTLFRPSALQSAGLARGPAGERANMAAQNKGPGGKQPTINDVAALAGVSKKTVRRVINRSEFLTDKTRAADEKAIEQPGRSEERRARDRVSQSESI